VFCTTMQGVPTEPSWSQPVTDICNMCELTKGMLGDKLLKTVHCCIRNKVMAAMRRLFVDGYSLASLLLL